MVTLEDFRKIDLRIAEITEAEKIENSSKLLKLKINLGEEERQLVAGIAKFYRPEDLIGKEIIIIANLEPKTLMGYESRGMLLAVNDGQKIVLLEPEIKIAPGSKIY